MAVFAIGDVQGCYDALCRLLDKLKFDERRDTLWFCGDIVSRGPSSLKTLRFIRDLGESAVTVLGNHDINLINLAYSGARPRPNDRLQPVLTAHDRDELIHWLESRPFVHVDDERRAVLVHAGVPPGWTLRQLRGRAEKLQRLWLDELLGEVRYPPPLVWRDSMDRRRKLRYTLSALTRMRFCGDDGELRFDAKGHPDDYDGGVKPWFDFLHPEWNGRQIYFGHWSTLGDVHDRDVVSLDSGCVWGRALTAVKVPRKPRNLIEYECVSCAKRR